MANVKNNSAAQETRRRLLQAAGEIFADRGFHAATIKEITDRAGASLASVNYHFRDKHELYVEVLRRLAEEAAGAIPPDDQLSGDAANRLRQFIRHFCGHLLGRQRPPWEQVLKARELAEPTAALDPLYKDVVRPLIDKLSALIAKLMDLDASARPVGLAAASVLGQCVYYMRYPELIGRTHPQLGGPPDLDELANHISKFSLAGIRAAAERSGKRQRRDTSRM